MRVELRLFLLSSLVAPAAFAAPYANNDYPLTASNDSCIPQTCVPSGDSCDFYQCVESEYHCEATQYTYPIDYGFKYCTKFGDNQANFSPAGKQWIHNVRLCLQDVLLPLTDCSSTCQTVQTTAFASHPKCYVDNGVCTLFQDWINIFETVGIDGLLAGGDQVTETMSMCAAQYAGMAATELLQVAQALASFFNQIGLDASNAIIGLLPSQSRGLLRSLIASVGGQVAAL